MSKRMMVAFLVVSFGMLSSSLVPRALAQGPQEGIKVHGHWVIDVRNPDGTLASHDEFENALVPGGADILSGILARRVSTLRGWWIRLSPANSAPFGGDPAIVFEASITPPINPGPNSFPNLTIEALNFSLVLKGTATALSNGQIVSVTTGVQVAYPDGSIRNSFFSGTDMTTPATLSAGQIVQVSVTLSFS